MLLYISKKDGCVDLSRFLVAVAECFRQIVDGRMSYISEVRDDLPQLIGRKGMSLKEWAKVHREELLQVVKKEQRD